MLQFFSTLKTSRIFVNTVPGTCGSPSYQTRERMATPDPFCHNTSLFHSTCSMLRQSPVPCAAGCGEIYCSDVCRTRCWDLGHSLLCLGLAEDENHPLVRHKVPRRVAFHFSLCCGHILSIVRCALPVQYSAVVFGFLFVCILEVM